MKCKINELTPISQSLLPEKHDFDIFAPPDTTPDTAAFYI